MATAIPPRAAEVASNRPVRQIFRCCCAGTEPLDSAFGLKGMGKENLRKGMDNLKKM